MPAGLWARKVGRMVGVDHPLVPMQHHYLVTEDVPEVAAIEGDMPAVTDLEGFTYLQRERNGVLLGVYETNPKHWMVNGPGWDYGMELIPEEIERISPELSIGFERFPALQRSESSVGSTAESPSLPTATHWSARFRASATTGLRAESWRGSRRGRESASRWRTGSSTVTRATTSSAWTSRGSARTRPTTATCEQPPRSSTPAAS